MADKGDPRVLFAAERTLLAWNRTSISLMAFGFVVERFGLFLEIVGREEVKLFERHMSFYVGISFILLAAAVAFYSLVQHRRVLGSIALSDVPEGYNLRAGMLVNALIGCLGVSLAIYLSLGSI